MPNVGNSHNTDSSNYRDGSFDYAQLDLPASKDSPAKTVDMHDPNVAARQSQETP